MQEIDYFTRPDVKDHLFNILYLWAKDNTEFGYRQGMNEILGIIVYAVLQELADDSSLPADLAEKMDDEDGWTNEQVITCIFAKSHAFADVYWMFDRVMALGVRNLYQITKDFN